MIVPAFNEEASLAPMVRTVAGALAAQFDDYEILIINDGSQDGTGRIAEELARADHHVRVIHNVGNTGLGTCYRKGLSSATKEYVGWAPAKNSVPPDAFDDLFQHVGHTEIVAACLRSDARPWSRRFISRAFTAILNALFGVRLRYFNGPNILRTDLARQVRKTTSSFAFMAEIMIRLVHAGHSYVEVGIHNRDRTGGKSKAFATKNLVRVCTVLVRLFWEIRMARAFGRIMTAVHALGLPARVLPGARRSSP